MALTITSRDADGQLVTRDYPGDGTSSMAPTSDAAASHGTSPPGVAAEPPAGEPQPAGAPPAAAPPPPASGDSPATGEEAEAGDEEEAQAVSLEDFNRHMARLRQRQRRAERARDAERQQNQLRQAQLQGQVETLTQLLQGAAPPLPETPPPPTGPPQAEQYASHEDYVLAAARYGAQQELAARDQQTAQARQQMQAQQFQQQLVEREQAFKQAHPDFDEVVRVGLVGKVAPQLQQALMVLPDGPALAYTLATHPDLVARLNTLHPALMLAELGRLSPAQATPAAIAPGAVSPAPSGTPTPAPNGSAPSSPAQQLPEPLTPLTGSGQGVPPDHPAGWDSEEFRKRWNAGWRPSPRDLGRT